MVRKKTLPLFARAELNDIHINALVAALCVATALGVIATGLSFLLL